jgi:hypothetical protein
MFTSPFIRSLAGWIRSRGHDPETVFVEDEGKFYMIRCGDLFSIRLPKWMESAAIHRCLDKAATEPSWLGSTR